jgi:enterochelin esterase-like enzyme
MPDPNRRTMLTALSLAGGLAGGLAACAVPALPGPRGGGRFEDWPAFPSKHVAPRTVRVWLPPDYDDSTERHAVLYMQDGQNLFEPPGPMAHGAWQVDRHLVALRQAGAIRPTIVVAVWNAEHDRGYEYAPQAPLGSLPPELTALISPARKPGGATSPSSDAYLRFLVSELKPRIDAQFRTRSGREGTLVMGSSMGGVVSLYALASYPRVFGAAACLSTHWVITTNYAAFPGHFAPGAAGDPRVERMAAAYRDWLRLHLPAAGAHRLYFDHGTADLDALYAPHQDRVDALVAAQGYRQGVDWTTRVFPGAPHNESAWRERLAIPLRFLLRP